MSLTSDSQHASPPKLFERLLHWSLPSELKEPVLGDLAEEYLSLLAQRPYKANYWYSRQAFKTSLQFLTKTKRGLIMFLFGIAVFIGIMIMAMILSGDIGMFSNIPSIIMVIPPAIFFTLACSSKQSIKSAFAILLSEHLDFEKVDLASAKHVFNVFGNLNMLMGWIGVLIGAVAMASNMDDLSSFGPAFAVCILTLFYGLMIKALCYAAEAKIQFKIINQGF